MLAAAKRMLAVALSHYLESTSEETSSVQGELVRGSHI